MLSSLSHSCYNTTPLPKTNNCAECYYLALCPITHTITETKPKQQKGRTTFKNSHSIKQDIHKHQPLHQIKYPHNIITAFQPDQHTPGTTKKFLAVGKTCVAIFWSAPGFKGRTFISSGFSAEGTLILSMQYPTVGKVHAITLRMTVKIMMLFTWNYCKLPKCATICGRLFCVCVLLYTDCVCVCVFVGMREKEESSSWLTCKHQHGNISIYK